MKKESKKKLDFKVLRKPENFVLIFTLLYIMLLIVGIIERVSVLEHTSTTGVGLLVILKEFGYSFVITILLMISYMLYLKNKMYGVVLEAAVAFSMLIDIVISVAVVGFDFIALIAALVLPMILMIHAVLTISKMKKKTKKSA